MDSTVPVDKVVESEAIKEEEKEKEVEQVQPAIAEEVESKLDEVDTIRIHRWDAGCWDLLDKVEADNRMATDTEVADAWRDAWNEQAAQGMADEDEDTDFSQTEVVIRVQALRGVQSLRRRRYSQPSTKKRKRNDDEQTPVQQPSLWKRVKGIFA